MKYKELEKLNEIIKNLKSHPNSDENIQFILELMDQSITTKTLKKLIETKKEELALNNQEDKQAKFNLLFTNKEIEKMPKTFRKEFRAEGCSAHIRKRPCGKNKITYEIRYRKNGYNVSACGKTKEEAKENFINKLKNAHPTQQVVEQSQDFCRFTEYYFKKYRSKKVTEVTLKNDTRRYNKYLKPYFQDRDIDKITPDECQRLIDDIVVEGKGKTADEIFSLMNCIMKMAIAHHLIQHNPMDIVLHTQHQKEHGSALTLKESEILFNAIKDKPYETVIALAYYTGLRPNEYDTAKIEGDFIIAVNSKRKNRKIQYKKYPFVMRFVPILSD